MRDRLYEIILDRVIQIPESAWDGRSYGPKTNVFFCNYGLDENEEELFLHCVKYFNWGADLTGDKVIESNYLSIHTRYLPYFEGLEKVRSH